MSEKKKTTVCPTCGTEVPVNESKNLKKICNILRGVLEDDPADWNDEVEQVPASEEISEELQDVTVQKTEPTLTLTDKIKRVFSYKLINRIVVLVLALAMLLLAFAPFVSYRVRFEKGGKQDIHYFGTDNVQMTAASAYLLGENVDYSPIGADSVKEKIIIKKNFVTATGMEMGLSATVVMATVAYVAYLAICIAFAAFAVKDLISEFFTEKKNRTRSRKYISDALLCLLLCVFPIVAFLLLQACEVAFSNATIINSGTFFGAKLSWGAWLSFILAFLGTVFVCLSHSFGMLRLHGRYFDRRRIKHLISVVLVVLLLVSMLFPCLQVHAWDRGNEEEETASVNLWDVREVTKNERYHLYQTSGVTVDQKYEELRRGKDSDTAGEEFVHTVFLTSRMANIRVLYLIMEILSVVTMILGGLLLWSLLRRCFFGAKSLKMVTWFKILTLIVVIADWILLSIMQQMLATCLPGELMYVVDFRLGAGIICMLICAVLTILLRLKEKKEIEYMDEDYDNADVSYAPYVLEKIN